MYQIKILGTDTYYGKNKLSAEYFVNHFKEMGIDSTSLTYKVFGRESICVAEDYENTYTMGMKW